MSTKMNYIKLSQATTVCFDIDKVFCDTSLTIKKIVILDRSKTEEEISQIISNVLNAVDQHSLLINALKQKYDFKQSGVVKKVLPYEINKEVFGAIFSNDKTYVIGSIDEVLLNNKVGIVKRSEEFINQGMDAYVLGQNSSGSFNEEMTAVALIIVEENIKQSIVSSTKWLNENSVDVIVFSNDSPTKAASIAYEAGVKNTDKQISLENMPVDEIKNIAGKYIVFANASQEQRVAIIESLRAKGEKVIMIDRDVDNLPKALDNSKKISSNLHRAGLFLTTKFLLAVFLIPLLVVGYNIKAFDNPFGLYHYFVMDAIIDVFAIALIMLNKNNDNIKGKFIINILKTSLPGALTMLASALIIFALYSAQRNGEFSFGIYNIQTAITMSMISFMALGAVVLYNILSPLNKHHRLVMVITVSITAILLAVSAIVSYTTNRADLLFGISFMEMNGPAYLLTAIIITLLVGIYITIYRIIDVFKGKDE